MSKVAFDIGTHYFIEFPPKPCLGEDGEREVY